MTVGIGFVRVQGHAVQEFLPEATDPLPFIKTQPVPMVGSGYNARKAVILRNGSELRLGPSTQYTQIASLSKQDSVRVLGKSDKWFHVSVSDSLKGFVHQSLLK